MGEQKGECNDENAKYFACDAGREYIGDVKPRAQEKKSITTTTEEVEGKPIKQGRTRTKYSGRQTTIPDVEIAFIVVMCVIVGAVLIAVAGLIIVKTVQWRKNISVAMNAEDDSVFDYQFSDGLGFQYNPRLDKNKTDADQSGGNESLELTAE